MSRVFVAEESALGRKVVIKVLPPELGVGLNIDRFRREIQLAASLHHPNIVPLFAAGEADGLLYYTMPLIEGESLRAKLAKEGELPIGEAIRLLRDVVDALACAHEHGVVHRDIKPDNVLVSRHHAMVTDFGVAKALSEATGATSLTSTGLALGTPAYMAPEQAAADPHTDHRADLYALGVLAYEMLAGRPPFTGNSPQAVLAAQVTQAPMPVTQSRASVPPALEALVMRCLEKKPADRWQSADELLQRLDSMATPSGGTIPTTAVGGIGSSRSSLSATGSLAAPSSPSVSARPRRWERSGYLTLGIALALAAAWGIMRSRAPGAAAPVAAARRVVVLPFENQGDTSRQYFANGVTDAITTQLTGIAGLSVIPRSTAARYRGTQKSLADIGRELGVGYILEGTVQWQDAPGMAQQVRVSPELIRVSDTTSVWAHGYDAVTTSVFQVYSDVAEQVSRSLEVALNDPERRALAVRPTANPEAYDLYLRATDYLNRGISAENFRIALPMLERAVALDSDFAQAWARLSGALALSHWLYIDHTDEALSRARFSAERALALAPSLPEAHEAMGGFYYWGKRDYPHALAELAIAQRSQPNNVELLAKVGYVERRQGRMEEAAANFQKEIALDPGSPRGYFDLGETLSLLRRYGEGIQMLQRGIAAAPDEPDSYSMLVHAELLQNGDAERARGTVRQALTHMRPARLTGGFLPPLWIIAPDDTLRRAFLALTQGEIGSDTAGYYFLRAELHRLAGEEPAGRALYDSARAVLERRVGQLPDDYGFHVKLGLAYARLGRAPDAAREGKRAVELLPPSRDAYFGVDNLVYLATIYAAAGRTEEAVEQLQTALALPGYISIALLRVAPEWDPIRSDPAFQRLLARP